jgi:RNase adapter protein RapZ
VSVEERAPDAGGKPGAPVAAHAAGAPDDAGTPEPAALDVVVVTGLSGAGKNTAGRVLEDLGFFVVDNLPPALLQPMVELGARGDIRRFAAVVDVRSRAFSSDLQATGPASSTCTPATRC